MGKVVKSVFGGGGSSKSTSKETANSNNQNESWLMKNDQYKNYLTSAINEAQNYNIPQYQLAGENQNMQDALNNLAHGINPQGYKDAQEFMQSMGKDYLSQGQAGLKEAQGTLSQFQNMSQADYQNMMKSEYNSDLVKSQIGQLSDTVNEQYQDQVQALNQQANMAGGMGNSRAGVAQGKMAGAAAKAIASGTVQYQTAEEQNAYNRLTGYIGNRMNAAGTQANIAQAQLNAGYQAYNQGMNYQNQYNQATLQNWQNQLTAGNYQRTLHQQQLDVQRQNQLLSQSPSLNRLMMLNQGMLPLAGLQQFGTNSGSGTTTSTQPTQGGGLLGSLMGMAGQGIGTYFQPQSGFGSMFNFGQMGGAIGGSFGNAF
ncbi:hypothetical protein CB599_11680 [Salmonella enterica subsp. enterica serovar Adjame]|nr:hypothetical protein [Salmonella enterica subsp. enterica serovar Adjame]